MACLNTSSQSAGPELDGMDVASVLVPFVRGIKEQPKPKILNRLVISQIDWRQNGTSPAGKP